MNRDEAWLTDWLSLSADERDQHDGVLYVARRNGFESGFDAGLAEGNRRGDES